MKTQMDWGRFFFFQAEDGIRDADVTGVQTCALPISATDAGECTRIVTWYANGVASRAWAYPRDGEPRQLRFHRTGGETVIDLAGYLAEDLDRLSIEVPNRRLDRLTLIDTPGIASLSTDASARTTAFLAGDEERG